MYFTSNESLKSQLSIELQHNSVSVVFLELLAKMCGAVKLNYCNKCNKLTNFRILSFTAFLDCARVCHRTEMYFTSN